MFWVAIGAGTVAVGTGEGAGGWPFQSSGVPQRSHQMSMPRLGWWQEGQRTGVPIPFSVEPIFSTLSQPAGSAG